LERERRLLDLLRAPRMDRDRLVEAFLQAPLYRTEFASGLGTLYTATFFPAAGRVEYRWPAYSFAQSFERFVEQRHRQHYANGRSESSDDEAEPSRVG
jgi:hypothetical protein